VNGTLKNFSAQASELIEATKNILEAEGSNQMGNFGGC